MSRAAARWAAAAALLAGAAVGWRLLTMHPEVLDPGWFRDVIGAWGAWGPIVFVVGYGQPVIPLPISVMTIAAGLAFGPWWGWLLAAFTATARASAQFLLAKWLGRDTMARLMHGHVATLDRKIGARAFRAVLLIRLIPSLPYDVLNYGLGCSQVRFRPYVAATVVGVLPGTFVCAFFGDTLAEPEHFWKLALGAAVLTGWIVLRWALRRRPETMPVHVSDPAASQLTPRRT
ncbi:MAG TPA: TVP38/TMEM64 family protein [bacterium]